MSSRSNQGQQKFVDPAEMYKRLVELVVNETNNNELLVYDKEVLEYMSKQCEHLQTKLADGSGRFELFTIESHKLELQRIAYLIHKYMERRLRKIETNASQLINMLKANQDAEITLLSLDEINYLKRCAQLKCLFIRLPFNLIPYLVLSFSSYVQGIDVYINEVLLQQMPPNMQSFNLADIKADEESEHFEYKFVRALKSTSVVVDGFDSGEEVLELQKNGQYFLPYSALKPHLLADKNLLLM